MRLDLGHPVHCGDDAFGKLADVVIDPVKRRVTHLVVEPHDHDGVARLVPIELATGDDAGTAIFLRCTPEELRRLPEVEEFAYLRVGEFPLDDPDWDVGIQTVFAEPYYEYPGFDERAINLDPHVGISYDRIPKGKVEIRRASAVFSADYHRLGHVEGFLVDRDDRITHVVLERGHLFGRREVTVPIAAVARVAIDSVALALTKDEVGRLPTVPVHRWTARLADSDGSRHTKGTRSAA